MGNKIPTLDTDCELDSEVEEIAKCLRNMGVEVIIKENEDDVVFTNIENDKISTWRWEQIYRLPWSMIICCLIEDICEPEEEEINN